MTWQFSQAFFRLTRPTNPVRTHRLCRRPFQNVNAKRAAPQDKRINFLPKSIDKSNSLQKSAKLLDVCWFLI
jgi:hypothetical protein